MSGEKFTVGQFVEFATTAMPAPKPIGPYEILRIQPADDVRLRAYRIKSKAEPFERSAKEYEIVATAEGHIEPPVWQTESPPAPRSINAASPVQRRR